MSLILKHSVIVLLACAALPAQAAVQITEVMYDVSGADTGREWVEVTNTGSAALDVSGFKFFEANTNHALTLFAGSGVLQPNASAIIADDPAKFKADWPNYGGTLLGSSFSLSNTGEALAVKDGTLLLHDSVTYDSGLGAAGDGNALARQGSTFAAASPTPGTYSTGSTEANQDISIAASSSSTPAAPQAAGGITPSPITLRVQTDDRTMVGGGSFFEASVFGTQGLPLPARVIWNFGDGAVAEGARAFHAYSYPGKYAVVATAAYNYSAAMERVTVEAVAATVALRAEGDGSLLLLNQSKKDLQVGLWSLLFGTRRFVIPEDTVVLAGEGVRFAPAILGFAADTSATLRYPNDAVAATAGVGATSPLRGERVPAPLVRAAEVPPPPEPSLPATEDSSLSQTAAVGSSGTLPLLPFAGLVAILAAGAAGAYVLRPARDETVPTAEEFNID